jgi:DNA-binding transcriptional LysR family regulator
MPMRVMQAELERGEAVLVPVAPPVPGHRVFLCYQAGELGPSLEQILDLMRELIARKGVFT